ncbi:MAG: hydrogenase nickel incorporation protein HypA, partial [Candidatus Heimdallarchaeaceae archaeon]
KKNKLKRISEMRIKLGELQQIDREVFEFALKEIAQLKKIKINMKIKIEKTVLKCRVCGHKWKFSSATKKLDKDKTEFIHFVPDVAHVYLRCPKCKSPDFKIIKGRGVWVESIKGVK